MPINDSARSEKPCSLELLESFQCHLRYVIKVFFKEKMFSPDKCHYDHTSLLVSKTLLRESKKNSHRVCSANVLIHEVAQKRFTHAARFEKTSFGKHSWTLCSLYQDSSGLFQAVKSAVFCSPPSEKTSKGLEYHMCQTVGLNYLQKHIFHRSLSMSRVITGRNDTFPL